MKYALLLMLAACGATPVVGTWESLDTPVQGTPVDLTYTFTANNVTAKAVVYAGSSITSQTSFAGTYTWQNKDDGTHVLTSYSVISITAQGDQPVTALDTVCVNQANCEGYQFKANPAQDTVTCVCKKQELVFKVDGDTMTGTYDGQPVTFRHPR